MKRRYLILALGFVAFVGIVLGVLAMLPPHTGVTRANFARIKIGMTKAEVVEIFGRGEEALLIKDTQQWGAWHSRHGTQMDVRFEEDCVTDKHEHENCDDTVIDKLRRWLHVD